MNKQNFNVGDLVASNIAYDDMGHGRVVSISSHIKNPIIVVQSYNGEEYTYFGFDSLRKI